MLHGCLLFLLFCLMGLINDFEPWCLLEIEIHSRFVWGSHHSHNVDHRGCKDFSVHREECKLVLNHYRFSVVILLNWGFKCFAHDEQDRCGVMSERQCPFLATCHHSVTQRTDTCSWTVVTSTTYQVTFFLYFDSNWKKKYSMGPKIAIKDKSRFKLFWKGTVFLLSPGVV
jgi:hypothetical protein